MKAGDLATGKSRLYDGLLTLRVRWQETGETWQDAKRTEFEEQFLAPLELQLSDTLKRIERLAQIFHEARQACS